MHYRADSEVQGFAQQEVVALAPLIVLCFLDESEEGDALLAVEEA